MSVKAIDKAIARGIRKAVELHKCIRMTFINQAAEVQECLDNSVDFGVNSPIRKIRNYGDGTIVIEVYYPHGEEVVDYG